MKPSAPSLSSRRRIPEMMNARSLAGLVERFASNADCDDAKSRELVLGLLAFSPAPFSRHQFTPGHITATGLVLAPHGEQLLLVHHRRLDRWLLPGGHVEPEDAEIWDAARREVIEETGAVLQLEPVPILAGVDVHGIPGRGSEPYHLHHDLVFFFRASSVAFQVSAESRAVVWASPAELDRYQAPANIRRAYARVRELFSKQ